MSDPSVPDGNPYRASSSTTTPPPPAGEGFVPSQDDRNLALIAHLSGAAGIFVGGLAGFVGPLIIYLLKKETSPYVESQAKEALNFQITMLMIAVVCLVITVLSCGALFPVVFIPMVLQLIFAVLAALAVRDGADYRYPFNIRLFQ